MTASWCYTTDPNTRWDWCDCSDPDPATYNHAKLGYTFVEKAWGNLFYKTYGETADKKSYLDAKAQCESESAYLATPRSVDENAFITSLISNGYHVWIGVNDIDVEGTFVSVDGQD